MEKSREQPNSSNYFEKESARLLTVVVAVICYSGTMRRE